MLYPPVKKLGQNFLMDFDLSSQMVDALDLKKDDVIVEIGPGLGALTKLLTERLIDPEARIYAVEVDPRFVPKIDQMFLHHPNFRVIEGDILDWLPTFSQEGGFKILGSLPFYITSPILHVVTKRANRPSVCVFLVQKEVAQKLCGQAPKASYLSTFIQTFFAVEYLVDVPKEKFNPAPKVDGAIVKFIRKEDPMPLEKVVSYEGFLHKGFAKPRKMLNKVFTAAELNSVGIDSSLRPHDLDVSTWLRIFKELLQ